VKTTVRLTAPALEVAERAAAALGVSRDLYLERVIAREAARLDEHGRPEWWSDPVPTDQQVLSIDVDVVRASEEVPLKSA
jgi:hypothetical protein